MLTSPPDLDNFLAEVSAHCEAWRRTRRQVYLEWACVRIQGELIGTWEEGCDEVTSASDLVVAAFEAALAELYAPAPCGDPAEPDQPRGSEDEMAKHGALPPADTRDGDDDTMNIARAAETSNGGPGADAVLSN